MLRLSYSLLGLVVLLLVDCAHAPGSADGVRAGAKTAPVCQPGTYLATHNVCVPDQWACSPLYYGAGLEDGCDCDCGVRDPDCDAGAVTFWQYGSGLPKQVQACLGGTTDQVGGG